MLSNPPPPPSRFLLSNVVSKVCNFISRQHDIRRGIVSQKQVAMSLKVTHPSSQRIPCDLYTKTPQPLQ